MDARKASRIRLRRRIVRTACSALDALGYDEVETPLLVRAPGQEPAVEAFATRFVPEMGAPAPRPLWLHTSPEYAMKRLLADGWRRVYQVCKVFRNGEVSATHNPEFAMLELYRTPGGYREIMDDLEHVCLACARAAGHLESIQYRGRTIDLSEPFERLTVRDAMLRHAGLDVAALADAGALRAAARSARFHVPDEPASWEDVFFSVFLSAVEPRLGMERPTFLVDWPARMASLARLRADDPSVAERFELYAGGLELANGFTELDDAGEQRARFLAEQEERRRAGREVYPLDERFLEAVGRLPPSGGVALGLDRLTMLLTGAETIAEVLLFPAVEEWAER